MSLSSRTLLTTAALAAAVIAPSAANAAEGFTAVTSTGDVVQLHSDTAPGLTGHPQGHGPRRRRAASSASTARRRASCSALTSAGNIASVDRDTGKATPKFPAPVTTAVAANAPVTFAVAPDGASARIITARARRRHQPRDRRRHQRPGPHLRGRRPARRRPGRAGARLRRRRPPDRRRRRARAPTPCRRAAGAATLQTLAGVPFPTIEPTRSTVASDGSVWTAANLSDKPNRAPQSRLVRYDPATGQITGQDGAFLGVRLDALAADGPVADDKTAPEGDLLRQGPPAQGQQARRRDLDRPADQDQRGRPDRWPRCA